MSSFDKNNIFNMEIKYYGVCCSQALWYPFALTRFVCNIWRGRLLQIGMMDIIKQTALSCV